MVIEVLIMVFAAIVLVYGGIQITTLTMSQKTASLGIPMGYIYVDVYKRQWPDLSARTD